MSSPENVDQELLKILSRDLLPGEKIMVFGPGRCRAAKVDVSSRLVLILIAVLIALCLGPTISVTLVPIGICLVVVVILAKMAQRGSAEYFALTNDRLLRAGDDGVQTVALRADIKKIQSRENKVTLTIGDEAVVISQKPISSA